MASKVGIVEAKLKDLGIQLPAPSSPKGNYVSLVRVGNLLHLSGHIPQTLEGDLIKGKLGADLSVQDGYNSARMCALSILSTVQSQLGTLDTINRIVKVVGFVNCTDDFTQQPSVINGASDLFAQVLGENGVAARSAVGTNALPLGVATEVECIIELSE